MLRKRQIAVVLFGILLAAFLAGCKKKPPPPPPPPPPKVEVKEPSPPAKPPTIGQFTAEPTSIERGQSSTLRWSVEDATSVSIDQGIGTVQGTGSRRVFPNNSTTYTLTAGGPGGSVNKSATVNVTVPPPPPPPVERPKPSLSDRLSNEVQDVYFDYDKSDVRADAQGTLNRSADALKAILSDFPNATIVVEGHCDERGSAEYNLGLGDRRAAAVREYLGKLGVGQDRLRTISYGKERPVCTEQTEDCYQKNRHVHFVPGQ